MKERFSTIWSRHTFTTKAFAVEAGVGESIILAMLEGKAIAEGVATHVLATFATLTGKPYSLENVEIALVDEGGSEIARVLARIDAETEAMMRGLYGISEGSSRHEVITARWEAVISRYYDDLVKADQASP